MIDTSIPYEFSTPLGSFSVGPDMTLPNWVAHTTGLTHEVSTSDGATALPLTDGALIGPGYDSYQSIVMDLWVPGEDLIARADRAERIAYINSCTKQPGTVKWTERTGMRKQLDDWLLQTHVRPRPDPNGGPGYTFQLQLRSPHNYETSQKLWEQKVDASSGEVGVKLWNEGNHPTPPLFYIYGPFTNLILQNVATGEVLIYDGTVADGHYLRISCDPIQPSVLLDGVTNVIANLNDAMSSFWQIAPFSASGEITLHAVITGAGTNTAVQAYWRGAWS